MALADADPVLVLVQRIGQALPADGDRAETARWLGLLGILLQVGKLIRAQGGNSANLTTEPKVQRILRERLRANE